MIIINLILFIVFLFILIRSSNYCIKYASKLAKLFRLPEFIVSFFIIAIISVLPEATISIIAAFNNEPELALGTLLGSNVADLALVFGVVALFSSGGIKVKSKILRNNFFYLILLIFPLALGIDGKFSRLDGLILITVGILFFVKLYMDSTRFRKKFNHTKKEPFLKSFIFLILSLAVLLIGAFFTVKFAVNFAYDIKIPAILIGITVLAIGTCLPELVFSIRAVKINRDELALGDILGTVITDATIILGIVALISPFDYNPINIYVLGGAMILAGIFSTFFMRTNKSINRLEGILLILFYIVFVVVGFIVNNLFLT